MVHCCYDFRLKYLECLIEKFEHLNLRFEFNVLSCFVEFLHSTMDVCHYAWQSSICIYIYNKCVFT